MKNRIIFPFNYQKENRERYATTMQIAKKNNAEVVLFTTVGSEGLEDEIDQVYLHLLELNGYYQTNYNNWGTHPIKLKRVIKHGNLGDNLVSYIEQSDAIPLIMARPKYLKYTKPHLQKLLEKLSIPPHMIVE